MESISRKVRKELEELETDELKEIKMDFEDKVKCEEEECWIEDCLICGSSQVALARGSVGCNCYLNIEEIISNRQKMENVENYFTDRGDDE